MTRQHLRALFSDSSSRSGSKHRCFVAKSLQQTWSKMLWQTQSKTLSKHRPCAAKSAWQSYQRLCVSITPCNELGGKRQPKHGKIMSCVKGSPRKEDMGTSLLETSVQPRTMNISAKWSTDIWDRLRKASSRERKFMPFGDVPSKGAE